MQRSMNGGGGACNGLRFYSGAAFRSLTIFCDQVAKTFIPTWVSFADRNAGVGLAPSRLPKQIDAKLLRRQSQTLGRDHVQAQPFAEHRTP
jgi:hypothetical protein